MANEISKLFVTLGMDDKGFQAGVNRMQKSMAKVGKGMAVAGGAIIGAVAGIGGASLKMAADFDSAMREVNTMMLLNEAEFAEYTRQTKDMAAALGVDAVEAAEALYQAISAGVPKDNAIEFLTIATKAAIGGVTDTETAVDGLTTVINAFKLPMSDAQKVADLMFTTVKGGKTTFEELSASLFQVAPIAAAAGVSFEEVSAALATMTKQGVPTSVATTQLRQAMVALQKPTQEMNEVIQGLGYESGQTMLKERGLASTLTVLRDATGGSNEMLMKMFGSVEAGGAVLALTGENAAMFATDIEAMANSTGAATDAFAQMEQSTSRQMEKLQTSFKDIGLSIGTALMPALILLIDAVKPIVTAIGNWVSDNPELTKTILVVAGVIGVLLVGLGSLMMMLGPIAAGFTLMMGPVGLVILGIAALIAIGVLLWKNWDTIAARASEIWGGIRDVILTVAKSIIMAINWIITGLNSIRFNLPSWVPGIGGKSFGINIAPIGMPSFAVGGIVTSPMIAQVGDVPEAIVPLDRLQGMGAGSTVNVYVAGSVISERELASIVREIFIEDKISNVTTGFV